MKPTKTTLPNGAELWATRHRNHTSMWIDPLTRHEGRQLPGHVRAAISRASDVAAKAIWLTGSSVNLTGPSTELHVPHAYVEQATAALTAAEVDGDTTSLDQLTDRIRPPFDRWLAPGPRVLRRGDDFTCPPSHFLKVLRGEAHRRQLRLNGRASHAAVRIDPQPAPTAALVDRRVRP